MAASTRFERWTRATHEGHPLASLDGRELAGLGLAVLLGQRSRFGARYFAAFLQDRTGNLSLRPIITALHNQGPEPSYNWVEVAETADSATFPDGHSVELGPADQERLFTLLFELLPPGGHLMVEYDSPQRAETAQALAHSVPPVATPVGNLLFRIGFGAHFKDWQIAEGGSEGPRKLQAYKPPSEGDARRWCQRAAEELERFLEGTEPSLEVVREARGRAERLLPVLQMQSGQLA